MNTSDEYVIKKENNNTNFLSNFNFFDFIIIFFYLILISSVFMQFVPVHTGNWFSIGMGKYVGIAAIFGIYCLFIKNYFAAFFISLFSSFFVFHEVIIFYDDYAIELGKELGPDGTFRLVFEIFSNAFKINFGAFWAVCGSLVSFCLVTITWIINTFQNNIASNKEE